MKIIETILPAVIGVAASLLTLFITRFFDDKSEKRKEKERFFYEIFPKRLELSEQLIIATDFVANTEEVLLFNSAIEISDYYKEKLDKLFDLGFRCTLFGSSKIVRTLALLTDAFVEFDHLLLSVGEKSEGLAYRNLINSFTPSAVSIKNKLLELIREESGVKMIDDKTKEFLSDIGTHKNIAKNSGNNGRTESSHN